MPGINSPHGSHSPHQGRFFAAMLVLMMAAVTVAQSTDPCNGDPALGICDLDETTQVRTYDPQVTSLSPIGFSTRSCKWQEKKASCQKPAAYALRIDGLDNGASFLLTAPGGETAAVSFTFTDAAGSSAVLLPGIESAEFSGTMDTQPVSLDIALDSDPATLLPGTYRGQFQLSISQQAPCGTYCAQLTGINFWIELVVEPRVRVSGLGDMAIDANLSGLTQAEQTFCVYSQGGARFAVRADSSNGNGNFILTGFDIINYETWVENLLGGSPEELSEGQISSQSWEGNLYDGCLGSSENMRLVIRIQQTALADAKDSTYTDTLTLTVELE